MSAADDRDDELGEPLTLVEIRIRRGARADGLDLFTVDLPDPEDASLVEVLGLLELAKVTAVEARTGKLDEP